MSMDMNKMLQQVQQMQEQMVKAQEELKNETVEASAGGGTVTVKVSGALEVLEVRIAPEAIDPDDPESSATWAVRHADEVSTATRRPTPRRAAGSKHRRPGFAGAGRPAPPRATRSYSTTAAPDGDPAESTDKSARLRVAAGSGSRGTGRPAALACTAAAEQGSDVSPLPGGEDLFAEGDAMAPVNRDAGSEDRRITGRRRVHSSQRRPGTHSSSCAAEPTTSRGPVNWPSSVNSCSS